MAHTQRKATSMSAVLQQISLAIGVAVASAILEIETKISDGPLELENIQTAFMIIAIANILAAIPFLTMAENAGASVSRHRLPIRDVETAAGK